MTTQRTPPTQEDYDAIMDALLDSGIAAGIAREELALAEADLVTLLSNLPKPWRARTTKVLERVRRCRRGLTPR